MKMYKKLLVSLGLCVSLVLSVWGSCNGGPCSEASFLSKGCETQAVTIDGFISTQYQWIDLNDGLTEVNRDPCEYNNCFMKHIRVGLCAELGCDWKGYLNVDFAGKDGVTFDENNRIQSSCEGRDRCKIYVHQAYIQKVFCDTTFRVGHQNVNWALEQRIDEQYLKPIDRSVATNFFVNLGHRAVSDSEPNYVYRGEKIGGRHTGVFICGDVCNLQYSAAIMNSYQGLCRNSTEFNNDFAYAFGLCYDCDFYCDSTLLVGINSVFSPKGSNAEAARNKTVYGFNPYAVIDWCNWNLTGEFFCGSVENGRVTSNCNACPWGVNITPVYKLNNCWELVGRFSYVNTDSQVMTIHQSFGCAPNNGTIKGGENDPTEVANDVLFEKVYAGYLGVNYYWSDAIKASFGLEQVKFKNRSDGADVKSLTFDHLNNKGAKLNVVRASLQLLF